jgi:hypothetical protein
MNALRWFVWALLSGLLLPVSASSAEESLFSVRLHANEFVEIGLTALTPGELTTLNQLVAREVASARQGGVTAFRGTFLSRRTPAERMAAGLDKLSPAGQDRLNQAVATALTARHPTTPVAVNPAAEVGGIEVRSALKPEVHGSVTLGYGWGRGGSYRFGSVDTWYYDPESRITIGLGVGTVRGSGLGRGCWRY